MSKKAEESKSKILAAAMSVMQREGARALTLDKVALQAEVSKGGLMYHFKSKNELFLGLMEVVAGSMRHKLDECLARETDLSAPGRFTRAYMRVNLESILNGEVESMRSLIEVLFVEPGLMERCREELMSMHTGLANDGIDALHAKTLAAASDGCWMNVLFGFTEPHDPQIQAMHDYLFALSHQTQPLYTMEAAQ